MACSCCKSCFAILAIVLLALWYHGCSLHSVLQTLSAFPVVGPFLIENSLVIPRTRQTTATSSDDAANERLFTAEELREYRGGENSKGLYLACIGLVYDVQKAERHYGPGNHYHPLTGRDGSRSFITGNFTDAGLSDDVSDFSGLQLIELKKKWIDNYPKDYPYVGKLIGRYYDANGQPTEALNKLKAAIERAPILIKLEEDLKLEFAGCSSYFLVATGGRFWCEAGSGPVKRENPGYPRRFVLPETGAARCVCAQEHQLNDPRMSEYPDCPKDAHECHLKKAPPHTEL